jgi:hypothetical protein
VKTRLFLTLIIGAIFGCLGLLMIHLPDRVGAAAVFALPGAIIAIIASGNVHVFNTWVVVAGNFAFYFAVSNLVWWLWERHTRKQSCSSDTL